MKKKKRIAAAQLDSDLAVAAEMVDVMSKWERHDKEVALLLSLRKSFDGDVCGKVYNECKQQDITTLGEDLSKTRGILFSISYALSSFKGKHTLVPCKRKRPSWMVSLPSNSEEHQNKIIDVPIMYFKWYPQPGRWTCDYRIQGV